MKLPLPRHKGGLRAQRAPDRRLGELLGITAEHEDGMSDAQTGLLPPFNERVRQREDDSRAEQWRVPAAWSYAGPGVDTEEQPLIDAGTQVDGVDGRTKRKIGHKFLGSIPFRRRKGDSGKQGALHGRSTTRRGSLPAGAESAQNPFGDEHAIAGGGGGATAQDEQMEVEMETHDGPFPLPIPIPIPSTPPFGQSVAFPSLAAARSVSAPTTPKRSPRRRTSGSAKSWLSEVSNTSGSGGSLLRKSMRRRARLSGGHEAQMRSMQKTVQVLGPEAAGVVTKGTEVSPNKLRYKDFARQLRQQMRRHV